MPGQPADELSWVREEAPVWDADKARVIRGAPEGAFVVSFGDGEALPGDWWSVRDANDEVVGYGRLDTAWGGDAQILLAVAPDRQGRGVGSFILNKLDDEAASRGISHVHNLIREHPQRDLVHDWLVVRGFRGAVDGDLRKRVRAHRDSFHERVSRTPGTDHLAEDLEGRAPGHEEPGRRRRQEFQY